MKPLGLGAIGSGEIAINSIFKHLVLGDTADKVYMAAVCDPVPGRAQAMAEQYGIKNWYMTDDELLADPNVDVVSICSPIRFHYEQGLKAIRAGKHVHFNKTMAMTSEEATELLKTIGDFERISDHAVNVLESAEELRDKELSFSDAAHRELSVLTAAVDHILTMSLDAFRDKSVPLARQVEPLEQVIDGLKEQMRTRHILRLQQGQCSIETGFVWCDLLTDLERTSDHCSNIAGCVIDAAQHNLNLHETLRAAHSDTHAFRSEFERYAAKYALPAPASAQ